MTMRLPDEYMNGKPLHRALAVSDITADVDTGRVTGRLVPYGKAKEIGPGVTERFLAGAFSNATKDPGRVKFRGVGVGDGHQMAPIIGHAVTLEDRADGPWATFRVADTSHGRDTLTLLRPGPNGEPPIIDELSIEFATTKDGFTVQQVRGGVEVTHSRARLLAVAPVPAGAYGRDALVTQVRSMSGADHSAIVARLRGLTS